jgi:hypothetical protein
MLKPRLMHSGQIFSGEFVVSYLIFLVVLMLLLYLWNTTTRGILDSDTQYSINEASVDVAEQLVRTPGNPFNWTARNVSSIGLANESRRLMRYKIIEFIRMLNTSDTSLCDGGNPNYECNRYLLGLGNYELYFNLTYINKTTVVLNDTQCYVGRPPVNETRKITVVRAALIDEDIVLLYLTVWKS